MSIKCLPSFTSLPQWFRQKWQHRKKTTEKIIQEIRHH